MSGRGLARNTRRSSRRIEAAAREDDLDSVAAEVEQVAEIHPATVDALRNYCEQLQTLKLRNNPLKIVRPEIGQLSNLRTLIMSFGLLMSLPAA